MTSLRYLVVGGAGFIGSYLVDSMLNHGAEVVVLDNFSTGSDRNLDHLNNNSSLEVHNLDIIEDLPRMNNFDSVFHLAAIANPTDYEKHPLEALLVNSKGNQNLMSIAKRSGARYYFFSSSEVYGHHDPIPQEGLIENGICHLKLNHRRSPYYVGKIYGEELVKTICELYGLEYVIIRPFNIYGPRMDLKTAYGRVIPNFIRWAMSEQPLAINGDGSQERSFCFIDDFVECIMKSLAMRQIKYNILNVGNPVPIKILALAQMINRITGNKAGYTFSERYKFEPKYRTPNIDCAREWLDWKPKISLEEGITAIIEHEQHLKEDNYGYGRISCRSHV